MIEDRRIKELESYGEVDYLTEVKKILEKEPLARKVYKSSLKGFK